MYMHAITILTSMMQTFLKYKHSIVSLFERDTTHSLIIGWLTLTIARPLLNYLQ